MLGFTARTWRHIRGGTLIKRIGEQYTSFVYQKRLTLWNKRVGAHVDTVIRLGPKLKMKLYHDSQLSQFIFCNSFEQPEQKFLQAFLRTDDIFVDVGANIGLFTLLAAQRVGCRGRVFTFEPSQSTFQRLKDNIHLNKLQNVKCYQLALSEREEMLSFTIALDGWDAWNSLAHPTAGTTFTTETVKCITWDQVTEREGLVGKVALMKIDVEGWETHVLRGAKNTLSRDDAPTLLIEFTEAAAQNAGTTCAALYRELESLGYQLYVFDASTNTLKPDPLRDSYPYINLVAVKCIDAVRMRLQGRG
jgi:FkbM family methyltransferase